MLFQDFAHQVRRPPATTISPHFLQGTQAQAQAVVEGAAQLMGAEPAVSLDDVFRTTAGDTVPPDVSAT